MLRWVVQYNGTVNRGEFSRLQAKMRDAVSANHDVHQFTQLIYADGSRMPASVIVSTDAFAHQYERFAFGNREEYV